MPVAMPARLVHPARPYGALGLSVGAGAHGCVLCWGDAGGRGQLLCVVFPVLYMCAATYSVHAL